MIKVNLFTAYYWECLKCGAEQFCKSIPVTEEEKAEIDIPEDCDLVTCPTSVLCNQCLEYYETEEYGEPV